MPQGKGTYARKVGRPPSKSSKKSPRLKKGAIVKKKK